MVAKTSTKPEAKPPAEPEAKPPAEPVVKVKKVRKKPVRKSPALKDYPNRLAWLKAMTEYELSLSAVENLTKVARIDLRIAAKRKAIDVLTKEIGVLQCERNVLDPPVEDETETKAEGETDYTDDLYDEAEPVTDEESVTGFAPVEAPETPVP